MIKYQHFALNNLFLANGYVETQTEDGIAREYLREDELEQCVRRLVLRKPEPLRGWDLRFLRRGLGLSQADFARLIDKNSQTVARLEKSADIIPKPMDLMIRARFAERFEPQIKLIELLSFSDGTAPALPAFIQLSLTENGWGFDFEPRKALPLIKARSVSSVALPFGYGPVQAMMEQEFFSHSIQAVLVKQDGCYPSSSPKIEIDEAGKLLVHMHSTSVIAGEAQLFAFAPSELHSNFTKQIKASGNSIVSPPPITLTNYSRTFQ